MLRNRAMEPTETRRHRVEHLNTSGPLVLLCVLWLCASTQFGVSAASAQDADEVEHFEETNGKIVWPILPEAPEDAGPPKLAVFFDLVRETRERHVEINEPFEFYVVVQDAYDGVRGFEFTLEADAPLTIISTEHSGVNVSGGNEFRVGIAVSQCLLGRSVVIMTVRAVLLEEAADLQIRVGGVSNASVAGPAMPAYLTCEEVEQITPLQIDSPAAILNPEQTRIEPKTDARPSFLTPVKGR